MFKRVDYPDAFDLSKVGKYPLEVFSGGGYFYDDLLEYRVWKKEAKDIVCYSFGNYKDALRFSKDNKAEKPIALVGQNEYIDEQDDGVLVHIKRVRLAEWQVGWLKDSKGTSEKIPIFIAEKNK